jgi:hypothetical protein
LAAPPHAAPVGAGRGWSSAAAATQRVVIMLSEHDVIQLAALVLEQRSHVVTRRETSLDHCDTKFSFRPRLMELHELKNGGFRSVTTITTTHPKLAPNGIFEFQHATGDSVIEAVCRGFDDWTQTDFTVLQSGYELRKQYVVLQDFPKRQVAD